MQNNKYLKLKNSGLKKNSLFSFFYNFLFAKCCGKLLSIYVPAISEWYF